MTAVTLPLPRGAFRHSSAKTRAFSLIEVVLAVGVVAFAFVAIMGLIPAGMGQFRQAVDTSVCATIAQRVINDAQQADFATLIDERNLPVGVSTYTFRLPSIDATNNRPFKCIRYFDEQGNEIIPTNTTTNQFGTSLQEKQLRDKVTYQVNVRVLPRGIIPTRASGLPYYAPHLATLTIQVAYNPGFIATKLSNATADGTDPARRLWIKTPGVTMINYSAQIARN